MNFTYRFLLKCIAVPSYTVVAIACLTAYVIRDCVSINQDRSLQTYGSIEESLARSFMDNQSWTFISSREVRTYRTLSIREDRYRFAPRNVEADFVVCDSDDWVLVIAITTDERVILVDQFRHGIGSNVLEIPGGVMEVNESPLEAGARELREETGYVAEQLEALPPFLPNPAINTAKCHVIVATGCRCESATEFDPFEEIDVHLRPLAEIPGLIRRGKLEHGLTIAAFSLADLHGRVQQPKDTSASVHRGETD
ncbi:MAG: NUDIX hydrolase [Pseudomonadota bacterium]